MDRRAIFFVVAGAVSALLAIPLDDELQWVPLALAGLYAVLALASFLDHWSQQHGADDPGPTPP